MAQNYLKFGSFTPPDVDEDGYQKFHSLLPLQKTQEEP